MREWMKRTHKGWLSSLRNLWMGTETQSLTTRPLPSLQPELFRPTTESLRREKTTRQSVSTLQWSWRQTTKTPHPSTAAACLSLSGLTAQLQSILSQWPKMTFQKTQPMRSKKRPKWKRITFRAPRWPLWKTSQTESSSTGKFQYLITTRVWTLLRHQLERSTLQSWAWLESRDNRWGTKS